MPSKQHIVIRRGIGCLLAPSIVEERGIENLELSAIVFDRFNAAERKPLHLRRRHGWPLAPVRTVEKQPLHAANGSRGPVAR
jgi:hypothetical protein